MTNSATDDLTRPLGLAAASGAARERRRPSPRLVFGLLAGLFAALAVGQIWLGRRAPPANVAEIRRPAPVAAAPAVAAKPEQAQEEAPPKRVMNAQDMEQASGVTVVRGGGSDAPQSVLIQVPPTARPTVAPPDRKLLEKSRHGALPRIGPDGTRPSQAYARSVAEADLAGKPRVAILIGGLGVSQTATSDAIAKLPDAVSFAFAPYSADLERQAQRARSEGHELFLQAPMEPFDYPENDPGPHTLRVGASDAENIDKLQWVLSRMQGYVGVSNFMGAKFTAQQSALQPVAKEIADRGLMVLDDGSSNRSRLADVAAAAKAPAARADAVIDAVLRADAIDRELAKLEQAAREKGVAIGAASALPVSVERIARWAKTLDGKGIALVPVSNAIVAPRGAAR